MTVAKQIGEDFTDYFVRLFENKDIYGLNCEAIAALLNAENSSNYGESAYRKEYAAFTRGREYERSKSMVGVATRILDLSDFHFPFQLSKETFIDYIGIVDVLVLNGDLFDFKEISKFIKAYRQSPMDEIIGGRTYYIELIKYLQPKRVVVIDGNHDARFGKYFSTHLDTDLIELMPQSPSELVFVDGFRHYNNEQHTKVWYEPLCVIFSDIEFVYHASWYERVGKTLFAHPTVSSSGMLKTTEKAIDHFFRVERDFDAVVLSHTHKLGSYFQGDIALYEQGACCHVENMKYNDGKLTMPQQKGFLYLCQDSTGAILVDKTKLITL